MTETLKNTTKAEHSIRVVSTITGIAVETLRVWERRYGVPSPERKEDSNRRLYSDRDIEKLMRVAEALSLGFRPSDIIHKSIEEIVALLPKSITEKGIQLLKGVEADSTSQSLALLAQEDMEALQDHLRAMAAHLGAKRFLSELAHPLLVEVGVLWERGEMTIRQEHLLSECLTTELRLVLSSFDTTGYSPTILLATLPNEPHSLGLEMIAVYLAASQTKPRLLGRNTPPQQIIDAVKTQRADVVGLTITEIADIPTVQKQLVSMLRDLPRRVPIWVGGEGARKLTLQDEGLRYVSSWAEVDKALEEIRS
jgi:MerR family transcriptional regulator, light-induced transcriptional regulator